MSDILTILYLTEALFFIIMIVKNGIDCRN